MELVRVSVKARSEPNGVKPKMRDDKLKSGVNWQGAFKHKGRKTDGHKTKIWYNSTEQSPLEAAGRQLVRKFHTFSALTRFITLVLRLRNLHLSWDSWIQPTINLLNKLCIYTETLWYFKFISDCKTKLEQFPLKGGADGRNQTRNPSARIRHTHTMSSSTQQALWIIDHSLFHTKLINESIMSVS